MKTLPGTEQEEDVLTEETVENQPAIILYNDDFNTFEHVIDCLVRYCKHQPEQAHQCALIVHYKGKCDVKHGSYDDLKPIWETLLDNGLSAKIEV